MKKTNYPYALIAIIIATAIVLSACGPTSTPTPATETPDVVEPIYFSLIGQTYRIIHNEIYYSQRLINGNFSKINLDCSAEILEADQKLVLLSSIEWLAIPGNIQDIIDAPGTSSYTTFIIPGDGRDPDLGFTLPNPRLNAIEVVMTSLSTGSCGFIVAQGWLYKDIEDLSLGFYATKERHAKASLEGEFLINPAYIQGTVAIPTTNYDGAHWPVRSIDSNLLIFDGGNPGPITCNGVEQPAWYSVEKLQETWDVNLDDSQIANEFFHRRSIGDLIPMWGNSYPPEINTTILGVGWTYEKDRYHAYIILSLPDGCQITNP